MCLVLYGSETGNCADLADLVFDRLRRRGLAGAALKPFGAASLDDVRAHTHVFVVCATTGQGSLPANTQPLWSQLLRRSLPRNALAGVRLFSFGLGSSAYPKYNWAIRKIHARLVQLGAVEGVQRGEADDTGPEPYESVFDQWLSLALQELDIALQITNVADESTLLPPLAPLVLAGEGATDDTPDAAGGAATDAATKPEGAASSVGATPLRMQTLLPATVSRNDRITAPQHFQDVRHVSLALALDEPYEPGDVVCLYPANDDRVVDAVLEAQGWTALADRCVAPPFACAPPGGWVQPLTLRALLKWHLDLNSIPRRRFFALAQHFCAAERQTERMQQFCTDLDDLFDYTSRPRRSLAEVLLEFDSLRIPLEYLLDALPLLRPRQFSIASPPSRTHVDIAVAIVKYRTKLRRVRRGVCTYWLQQLRPGDDVLVSVERNRMGLARRASGRPVVLIATGTGIAPIRSLLLAMGPQTPRPYLFFGARFRDQDFLFGDELQQYAEVIPAFSREGGGYVQTQIEMVGPRLPLEDAFIFVCGSSGPMPREVRSALLGALQARGHTSEQAQELLTRKEKIGDYMQETW